MILAFTSTVHDPENRLGYLIEEVGDQLIALFESATVAYTPRTHTDTVRLLAKKGYRAFRAGDTIISSYQTALSNALDDKGDILFYCDLDRALHWMRSYPEELKKIAETIPEHDFILIGRTKRAFETHPETQRLTEGIGNLVSSKALGFNDTRDVLGTTWVMTPQLAKMILEQVTVNEFGFYSQWPIMLWRSASNPLYIERDGLEWETPDRYREEIRIQGSERWRQDFQTVNEWRRRTEMLRDFIDSATRFSDF